MTLKEQTNKRRAHLAAFSDYTLRALAARIIGETSAKSLERDVLLDLLACCI